jgi:hypothetical protein
VRLLWEQDVGGSNPSTPTNLGNSMTSEILAVPEEYLGEVIDVVRAGLKSKRKLTPSVRKELTKWCNEGEEYLCRLAEEDR